MFCISFHVLKFISSTGCICNLTSNWGTWNIMKYLRVLRGAVGAILVCLSNPGVMTTWGWDYPWLLLLLHIYNIHIYIYVELYKQCNFPYIYNYIYIYVCTVLHEVHLYILQGNLFPNCPMSLLTSQGSSGFSCPLAGSGEDSDATVWGAAPLFWGGWDWRSAGKVRAAPSVVHPTKCK